MEEIPSWVNIIIAIGSALGTSITAIATFFLWRVTKTLAHETTRLAEAAAQPHVVVTIKPNRWSLRHFDINIDNTGNATAYEIFVEFDPPLQNGEARGERIAVPFQKVSVLKPGQGMSSYLSEFDKLNEKTYRVNVSWKRDSSNDLRQINSYILNMADYEGISHLGDEPLVEITKRIKKIEESWAPVAKGQKRTRVDIFSSFDRLHEAREANRQRRRWQQEQEARIPHGSQIQRPQPRQDENLK